MWPSEISFDNYVNLTEFRTNCFTAIVGRITTDMSAEGKPTAAIFWLLWAPSSMPLYHCVNKLKDRLVLTEVILPGHSFGTLLTSHNPQPCRCLQIQKQWTEHYLQAPNWLFSLLKRTGCTTASLPQLTLKRDDKNINTE